MLKPDTVQSEREAGHVRAIANRKLGTMKHQQEVEVLREHRTLEMKWILGDCIHIQKWRRQEAELTVACVILLGCNPSQR